MKHNYFLLFIFLTSIQSFSQTNNELYNYKVNLNELKMKAYEKDSTANALVLYEFGNSYVHKSEYDLITEEKHKIKILNSEGFKNADVTIYLYNTKTRSEKVRDIIATTYNLTNGKVEKTKLAKKDIFREKYNDNYTLVKFTLPNIKEGSVITYSYTLQSPFMFKYKGWDFQSEIPKKYSEYRASIPGNWEYHIKLVGTKKLFIEESEIKKNCLSANGGFANCAYSIYAMKDIPAFIEEDYMTSKSNYLARIEYELKTFNGFDGTINNYTKTWKAVDREFRTDKDIGRQLNKSIKLEEYLSSEIRNEKNTLKKAKAIYHFIQQNYTWNGEYKIFKDVSVKNLIKNKSGNVSSINILLHNLLNAANINVKPVLVSTRGNGFPTKIYPVISDFNYLIVQVTINGQTYLLDATDKYLDFGEIPYRCLNRYARLMDFKNGSEWIDIEANGLSVVQYQADLSLDENESIKGKISAKNTGYHALRKRKQFYQSNDSYITNLEDNYPNIEIINFEVIKGEKTSSEFIESYNIEYSTDETGDIIYLNPFFVKFFTENPFKLQERTYPIDFGYKDTYFYALKFKVSDGYSIEEKPKSLNLTLPNNTGRLLFSSNINGNSINIMLKISFNEATYPAEYYPYLKEYMSKVVDIQTNSLIVLKKK